MKKLIPAIALSLALLTALPATAFAHGHGGVTAKQPVSLRATPNCNIVGSHDHDGILCIGHYPGDGHGCYQAKHGGGNY
jgi:hypothetical protein